MNIRFEWDAAKAASNLKKHKVSFDLATRVFFDPLALTEQDQVVDGEARWRAIGNIGGNVVLIVAYTIDDDDAGDVIRIISARRAEPKERRRYEEDCR